MTTVTVLQPVGTVSVICVVPVEIPDTRPLPLTVAIELDSEFHTPVPEASVSEVVNPSQTDATPEIGAGSGFTVSESVAKQPSGKI